jgi:serine/threonine-protein kinase RsbW
MAGTVVLEFPSEYKFLNIVDLVCNEVMQNLCENRETANEIAISVIEAVTNAIEHGNHECCDQNVRISFTCKEDRFCVEVEDCGKGFDYQCFLQNIPDPTNVGHLRGRGIYIMKSMMDSLDFEMVPGHGMKVRLEKALKPKADGEAPKD